MAEGIASLDPGIISDVKRLLWGDDLKEEVFLRWMQGFAFSENEATALVQYEGGPCAVIAPVQGFIIKNALFSQRPVEDFSQVTVEESTELLLQALCDIFIHVSSGAYTILSLEQESCDSNNQSESSNQSEAGQSSCKKSRLDQEMFHSKLRCTKCSDIEMMRRNMKTNISDYMGPSGVLLYLYSIILTKGIEQIKNEVEDPGEPLIDGIHGHGSQSLINLLITSKAVTNVWDNDKDVSGLKLHGVSRRAFIGFLSFMEHLRYCEVGWNLKNPEYPVWLIGSETHLTVLFSKNRNLVITETLESNARRIFQTFDPEGNGFIATIVLGDLLAALDLVSDKEYVDIMASKLDAENLGIITQSSFFEEFFAGETTPEVPKKFKLYHYNGLARSCHDNKVMYHDCDAVLQDEIEVQLLSDVTPMKMVLLTKWPTIEVKWKDEIIPSLN
ncbi:ubiquitin carboxyl-terminal hydrolase MINDY-3-like [Mercenaria mercenaria]|uniref:ubiquitin carboxyl-terminal hydrolase MINDY-3-like n=1 Tax=Mercenaria mercenaria TaxID=6596 RepID=UPI00234F93B4|nr:ubiquitin carboxyl-terminal hydrolase MINDY-3-like [Mercenaria mercenaria]